jgi:hypothetical protein
LSGIAKSSDPRPINSNVIGGVTGGEPGCALIRGNAIAHVSETLQVGEIETIQAINCQCRIAASDAGRRLAGGGQVARDKMKTLNVIGGTPDEAGGSRKSVGGRHVDAILRVDRDARLTRDGLVAYDHFAAKTWSFGRSTYTGAKCRIKTKRLRTRTASANDMRPRQWQTFNLRMTFFSLSSRTGSALIGLIALRFGSKLGRSCRRKKESCGLSQTCSLGAVEKHGRESAAVSEFGSKRSPADRAGLRDKVRRGIARVVLSFSGLHS